MTALIYSLLRLYDSECMEFPLWLNSFEYIVDFLDIPHDKKAYILLTMIESFTLLTVKLKIAPAKIEDFSYDKLVYILLDTFSPYNEKLMARYRFDARFQFHYESARHYADTLKKLIAKCNLDYDITSLLLNRFIIGLRNDLARKILLEMRNLTLDIAVNLVERLDICEKNYNSAERVTEK